MFFLTQNDTLPVVEALLSNSAGYVDLTNATGAYFCFSPKSRQFDSRTGLSSIVGPTSGHLRYSWTTGDVRSGGYYYYQWRVYFSGNNKITFPNDGFGIFSLTNNF